MNFTPLQTSEVTSAAKLIRSGLVYYWGFTAYVDVDRASSTLVVSDSNSSGVTVLGGSSGSTVTDIKTWATLSGGTMAVFDGYVNSVWPNPVRCRHGLRAKLISGHSGVTVLVHYT